jgi:hypothetical protein
MGIGPMDIANWALPVHCELGPGRLWLRRHALHRAATAVVATVVYGIALALFLLLGSSPSGPAVDGLRVLLVLIAIAAFVVAVVAAVSAARWFNWSIQGYPPRLRLTPRGIDVRCYTEQRYDLSVPWREMERVAIKEVWGRPYLCLTPKGPHRWIPEDSRLAASVESCFRTYGAPFVADLSLAGVSLEEFDRLLRHYSGGRFSAVASAGDRNR